MNKKCFLISGSSGVGKTSIAYEVIKKNNNIEKVITSTSRIIRPNETNGIDYYFYEKDEFKKMLERDEFFESALIFDNYYGSEKKEVDRIYNSGHVPLFVCDVQGVVNLSKSVDNLVKIFILPDSFENLKKRLEERPGSTPEDTEKRLKQVSEESKIADICEYSVINEEGELEKAVNQVLEIISRELTN